MVTTVTVGNDISQHSLPAYPFVLRPPTSTRSFPSTTKTLMFGPLNISFAPQVQKSRTLYRWFKPFADWYAQIAGYRQMGLKYDDLRKFVHLVLFDHLANVTVLRKSLRSVKTFRRYIQPYTSSKYTTHLLYRRWDDFRNGRRTTGITASVLPHKLAFCIVICQRSSGQSPKMCVLQLRSYVLYVDFIQSGCPLPQTSC